MKKIQIILIAALAAMLLAGHVQGAPMTNNDVVKMVKAGLDQSIIITSVQNAESGFDISPNGLIDLANAGVPKPIIGAIVQRASGASAPATATATAAASSASAQVQSTDEIIMVNNGVRKTLNYMKPTLHKAARGLGFGGVAVYAVFPGVSAATRATPSVSFIFAVPEHASIEAYATLVRLEPRKNGTREILIGSGGMGGASSGVPKERNIPLTIQKSPDQSRAPAGYVIYNVAPAQPLQAGEYAFSIDEKGYEFGVDK